VLIGVVNVRVEELLEVLLAVVVIGAEFDP
jgi:hypothetical protein